MNTQTNLFDAGRESHGGSPLVELEGLFKRYGATQALDDVSMRIDSGMTTALVGRNGAGKSTAVKVLTGLVKPDSGLVRFSGERAPDISQRELWRERVACVYQKSTVLPHLTVGENLFLNDHPRSRGGLINWKSLYEEGQKVLDEWGLNVGIHQMASELKTDQRQLLEIARALRLGTRLIVLDEPTAQLEGREIDQLFEHIRRLKSQGVTFLFISHHLKEIYQICERVVVMRDGRVVADESVQALDEAGVVSAMVGLEKVEFPMNSNLRGLSSEPAWPLPVVLDIDRVGIQGLVENVTLSVRAGEKVGIGGIGGCGKAELAEAIVGIRNRDSGTVSVSGKNIPASRVDTAIEMGIGFVPGDRHFNGFCANLSVEENLSLSMGRTITKRGFISQALRADAADELIANLQIKVSSPHQLASELSGGNQQKIVMARALATNPRALVLVYPTAGVDIASKAALFGTIQQSEAAVLLVSDEVDELRLCDRVLVMFDGRIVREFSGNWDEQELVAAMEGKI